MSADDADDAARALLDTHTAALYPDNLTGGEEIDGVSLVMLDADVAGLAAAFLGGGSLRPDQWFTLRAAASDARTVVRHLTGEAWVYFGRLFALAPGNPPARARRAVVVAHRARHVGVRRARGAACGLTRPLDRVSLPAAAPPASGAVVERRYRCSEARLVDTADPTTPPPHFMDRSLIDIEPAQTGPALAAARTLVREHIVAHSMAHDAAAAAAIVAELPAPYLPPPVACGSHGSAPTRPAAAPCTASPTTWPR